MQPVQINNNEHVIKNLLAHIVSIVLIPLFAPVYLFSIIFFYFPASTFITGVYQEIMNIVYIFAATTLPPFVIIFILYKMKKISSITLHNKNDRFIPQVFSCLNYLVITFILIYKLDYTDPLALSMISITLSAIVISIITPFWKISTHASGAAGIFTISSVLYLRYPSAHFLFPYITLLLLTVAVCMARLQLKAHTVSQVLAGCLLGSVIGLSCFYFLK